MKLTLGGKEYDFEYNNLTLFNIEKELDKPLIYVVSNEMEMAKLSTLTTIVWCGIVSEKPTFNEFAGSIHMNDIVEIQDDISKLIADSFDTGEKKKKK